MTKDDVMSIIGSNKVSIESNIIEWFEHYVDPCVQPNVKKMENGRFSHIDVNEDVLIHDFPEEKFPDYIVFKKINGNFELHQCHQLNNTFGFPTVITGDFICSGCENLSEDTIRYIEKDCVWNMQSVIPNDSQSKKKQVELFFEWADRRTPSP